MAKIRTFWSGGVVDEELREADVRKRLEGLPINQDTFCEWLRRRLGDYRFSEIAKQDAPSRSEELKTLRSIEEILAATIPVYSEGAFPPDAAALIRSEMHALGLDFHEMNEQVLSYTYKLQAAVSVTADYLQTLPSQPGRKKLAHRDNLLADIMAKLMVAGLKKVQAYPIAISILELNRVPVPENSRAQERALGKGQK